MLYNILTEIKKIKIDICGVNVGREKFSKKYTVCMDGPM